MTYDDGDDSLQALRSAWQESDSAPYRLERAALERQAGSVDLRLRIGSAVGAFVCLIEIVAFGMFFVRSHDNYHRAGALMTVLGTAYLIYQLWRNLVVVRALRVRLTGQPSLVYYRATLEQMRDWSRGRWFWPRLLAVLPGPILYSGADALLGKGNYDGPLMFLAIGLFAVLLNVFWGVRWMQRRINRLDQFAT